MATILIVDDDESLLELLKMHLAALGYRVRVASDAIAAGHSVLESPPDMIITDVMMPFMDGFEFIAALKSDPTLPEIPVIFLTSVADGSGRGKELGAVGYLTKPVRAERLAAMVAEHLPLNARSLRD